MPFTLQHDRRNGVTRRRRARAKKFIEDNWRKIAKTRTLGYGGPLGSVVRTWPFVRAQVGDLRGRVPDTLPMIVLQSRQSPPRHMEIVVPYWNEAETELMSRVVASSKLDEPTVTLFATFAQSIWFSISANALPSPVLGGALEDALRRWTAPELFKL